MIWQMFEGCEVLFLEENINLKLALSHLTEFEKVGNVSSRIVCQSQELCHLSDNTWYTQHNHSFLNL